MSQQVLPVSNAPNQTFTATLQVDGAPLTLQIELHYNEIAAYWVMTISDQNGNLLVDSLPLVTGNDPACNLLRQFSFLEIGSIYVINQTGSTTPNYPDNTNLGTGFQIIWGDTP